MIDTLSPEYQEVLAQKHREDDTWGNTGQRYAEDVSGLIIQYEAESVLDYGCGKATLHNTLKLPVFKHDDVEFRNYDPAIPHFASPPTEADIVVCTDVLEHIEPEYLDSVLQHIRLLTKKCCFLIAATFKARHVLPDGRNAHLIIRPAEWWAAKLNEVMPGGFAKAIGSGSELLYIWEPPEESTDAPPS